MLQLRIDSDSEWYPGKSYQTQHGPAPLLTKAKRRAIATSMMAAKKRGREPSTAWAIHCCPAATLSPVTSAPCTPKYIKKVFTEDCYGVTPDNPWQFQRCLQKTWLPPALQAQRLAWAKKELAEARPPSGTSITLSGWTLATISSQQGRRELPTWSGQPEARSGQVQPCPSNHKAGPKRVRGGRSCVPLDIRQGRNGCEAGAAASHYE